MVGLLKNMLGSFWTPSKNKWKSLKYIFIATNFRLEEVKLAFNMKGNKTSTTIDAPVSVNCQGSLCRNSKAHLLPSLTSLGCSAHGFFCAKDFNDR